MTDAEAAALCRDLPDDLLRSLVESGMTQDGLELERPALLRQEMARTILALRHDLAAEKAFAAALADKLSTASQHLGLVAQRAAVWITDWSRIEPEAWYVVAQLNAKHQQDQTSPLVAGNPVRLYIGLEVKRLTAGACAAIRVDRRVRVDETGA